MVMNGPLFGPGQGPIVLTPEMKAFKNKAEKVQACPVCPPGLVPIVIQMVPNPQIPATRDQNAFARCVRCMTSWEVTNDGTIVNKRTLTEQFAALVFLKEAQARAPFTPTQGEAHGR